MPCSAQDSEPSASTWTNEVLSHSDRYRAVLHVESGQLEVFDSVCVGCDGGGVGARSVDQVTFLAVVETVAVRVRQSWRLPRGAVWWATADGGARTIG
jgi:hypothetical protein